MFITLREIEANNSDKRVLLYLYVNAKELNSYLQQGIMESSLGINTPIKVKNQEQLLSTVNVMTGTDFSLYSDIVYGLDEKDKYVLQNYIGDSEDYIVKILAISNEDIDIKEVQQNLVLFQEALRKQKQAQKENTIIKEEDTQEYNEIYDFSNYTIVYTNKLDKLEKVLKYGDVDNMYVYLDNEYYYIIYSSYLEIHDYKQDGTPIIQDEDFIRVENSLIAFENLAIEYGLELFTGELAFVIEHSKQGYEGIDLYTIFNT